MQDHVGAAAGDGFPAPDERAPGGVGHGWVKRLFIDRQYLGAERAEDYSFIRSLVTDNAAELAGMDAAGCTSSHWISVGRQPSNKRWPSGRKVICHCSKPVGVGRLAQQMEHVTRRRAILARSVEFAKDRYEAGYAPYLEQLDAQRNLYQTEIEAITLRQEQLLTQLNLFKALGGGWAADRTAL